MAPAQAVSDNKAGGDVGNVMMEKFFFWSILQHGHVKDLIRSSMQNRTFKLDYTWHQQPRHSDLAQQDIERISVIWREDF